MRAGDWSPIQWYDSGLAAATHDIIQAPGMKRAIDLYDFGSPGQSTRDEFEKVPPGEGKTDDIWIFSSIEERLRTTLDGEPDARWRVKPGERRRRRARAGLTQEHLEKASHVLAALSVPNDEFPNYGAVLQEQVHRLSVRPDSYRRSG